MRFMLQASVASTVENSGTHSTPLNKVLRLPEINLPNPANLFAEIWRNPNEEEEERGRLRECGDSTSLRRRVESLETELRRERERSREREFEHDEERLRLMAKCEEQQRNAQQERDKLVQRCEEAEDEVRQYMRFEGEREKVFSWLGLSTIQAAQPPLSSTFSLDATSQAHAKAGVGEEDEAFRKEAALFQLRFEAAQYDERRKDLQRRMDNEWNKERAEMVGRWRGRSSSFEKFRALPPPSSEDVFEFLVPDKVDRSPRTPRSMFI